MIKELQESALHSNPLEQFRCWFSEAQKVVAEYPDAAALGTVSSSGRPSVRMVLVKQFDERGYVFFTNYNSHKAQDLETNPYAALTFYWRELHRQIRLEGYVAKVSREESEQYFRSRDRFSQLGAWASRQSTPLKSRAELEQFLLYYEQKFAGLEIPCPPYWGGYRLQPMYYEFWQEREHRLHDRFCYRIQNNEWIIERLAP